MIEKDRGFDAEAGSVLAACTLAVRKSTVSLLPRLGLPDDVENQSISPIQPLPALVYKFRPSAEFPKLRLLSSRTDIGMQVTLKAVVRRKSILIVTEKQGVWWNCTCSGYQGWANITPIMIQKGILIPIDRLRRFEDWRGTVSPFPVLLCSTFPLSVILSVLLFSIIMITMSNPMHDFTASRCMILQSTPHALKKH